MKIIHLFSSELSNYKLKTLTKKNVTEIPKPLTKTLWNFGSLKTSWFFSLNTDNE